MRPSRPSEQRAGAGELVMTRPVGLVNSTRSTFFFFLILTAGVIGRWILVS